MNRTSTIVRYAKLDCGWRRGAIVFQRNGKLKHPFMIYGGNEVDAPNGRYQLLKYEGSRPVYTDLGNDPADALARYKAEQSKGLVRIAAKAAGLEITPEYHRATAKASAEKNLEQLATDFVDYHYSLPHRSDDSVRIYRQVTSTFIARCKATTIDAVTHEEVVNWHHWMRETKGYTDRTAANQYIALLAFFRYCKRDPKTWIPPATHKMLRSFVSRTPNSYTADVVARLIASSNGHGLLWDFAWKTGLRDSELKMVTRMDIHLDVPEPYVAVLERDGLGRIKTGEERNVRLHPSLVPQLKAWLEAHPKRYLVFGTLRDKQDRKMLLALKRDARRAGLNCGFCDGCRSESNQCRNFTLHKFRRTYCSRMLVAAQGDTRLVMTQSGHKDMQSLMRYLAPTSQLTTTLAAAF